MNAWNNLWEKEAFNTTFGRRFPNFVYNWLNELKLDGDILEVGCGNASLVPFLLDNQIGKSYTGVDSAKIHFTTKVPLLGLDCVLYKETQMEDTSFIGEFDHVVSIFGIEYTFMFRTLPLVYESLKKNGQIHFMMHNSNSGITAFAKKQLNVHYSLDFKSTGNLVDDFKYEKIRHKEQVESAKDKNDIEVFKCQLEQAGFVDIQIKEQENKNAWLVSAKRG